MSSAGIALLIAYPSALISLGAALCLWLMRRRHPHGDAYSRVLERDFLIAVGMAMVVYAGVGFGALIDPQFGATALDAGVTYTIARITGLLMFANCLGCGAFVTRRVLWWTGWHPLQRAAMPLLVALLVLVPVVGVAQQPPTEWQPVRPNPQVPVVVQDPAIALAAQAASSAAQNAANNQLIVGLLSLIVSGTFTTLGVWIAYKTRVIEVLATKTHSLVNSAMGAQLLLLAEVLEERAASTHDPTFIARAAVARRAYDDHVAAQHTVDEKRL